MKNLKIKVNKIGSILKNMNLSNEVYLTYNSVPEEGDVLVVESIQEQDKYGEIELVNGDLSKIMKKDFIAGVLGERKALAGIVGIVPGTVKSGDILHMLNIGGMIGKAVSWNKDFVTSPIQVKVIGSVIKDKVKLNISNHMPKLDNKLETNVPLIVVMGTAMNVGKTTAVTNIIKSLAQGKYLNVAAAKLTGVAAQKDISAMKKAGAKKVLSFLDVGITSTINNQGQIVPAAKTLINELGKQKPDCIVIELGDGLIGWYGVDKILRDLEFINAISFVIVCAHDLVGAKGAYEILKKNNIPINLFAGPVTNNTAGTDYLEKVIGIPSEDLRYGTLKFLNAIGEILT